VECSHNWPSTKGRLAGWKDIADIPRCAAEGLRPGWLPFSRA